MWAIAGVIALTAWVYWCRWFIQRHLQGVCALLGLGQRGGLYVYTALFFPGVMLHEMSHFFMAAILGVRTGNINLFPRFDGEKKEGSTALGSVQVARSDALRGSLIGAAPFISGSLVIYFLVTKYFFEINLSMGVNGLTWVEPWTQPLLSLLWLYLILVVGNTMFSSKEDTHSWPLILIILIILGVIGWVTGTIGGAIDALVPYLSMAAVAFFGAFVFIALADLFIVVLLFIIERLISEITHKRVKYSF